MRAFFASLRVHDISLRSFTASIFLGFGLVICQESSGAEEVVSEDSDTPKSGKPTAAEESAVVKVSQVGTAKTRDGALIDACRLAVSQVHGTRVVGSIEKTNKMLSLKAQGKGSPQDDEKSGELQVEIGREVADQTSMSFGGLLTRYKVRAEHPPANADDMWQMTIDADVLTTIPDRFEGRIAVTVPSDTFLKRSINASPEQKEFVHSLRGSIEDWFANSPSFVLLERNASAESLLDSELDRASKAGASRTEQSKLGMQKTADVVVLVESTGVSLKKSSTSFKRVKTQAYTCRGSIRLTFKLVDGASKGEIGRDTIEVAAKATARTPDAASEECLEALAKEVEAKIGLTGLRLLGALDCTRLKVGQNGNLEVLSPRRGMRFKEVSSLRLRLVSRANGTEIKTADSELGEFKLKGWREGGQSLGTGWSDKISVGDILWFSPVLD